MWKLHTGNYEAALDSLSRYCADHLDGASRTPEFHAYVQQLTQFATQQVRRDSKDRQGGCQGISSSEQQYEPRTSNSQRSVQPMSHHLHLFYFTLEEDPPPFQPYEL